MKKKWEDTVTKKQHKLKPGNICRKNMVKRTETPGNNEFICSASHNPK